MSEAKDWAGELISGQTGTGRILVSIYSRILELTEQEPNRDFDGDQKVFTYHKEFE